MATSALGDLSSNDEPEGLRLNEGAETISPDPQVRLGWALQRLAWRLARPVKRVGLAGSLLAFQPRPGDIYIASYPRSGTTWMQMILYQLTTDGSMDFPHISQVAPFFERSLQLRRDLSRLPDPRIFKTHLPCRYVRRLPGKYIYVARNGWDVLISSFHFHRSHLGFRGTFKQFFDHFLTGNVVCGSWFRHVAEWGSHAHDRNMLFLNYEDLVEDLERWLPVIARFCRIELKAAELPRILRNCSFAFMKEHEEKFDHMNEILWERGFIGGSFLREGKVGSGTKLLTAEQRERFEVEAWKWGLSGEPKSVAARAR
jgi:hypothetical protein